MMLGAIKAFIITLKSCKTTCINEVLSTFCSCWVIEWHHTCETIKRWVKSVENLRWFLLFLEKTSIGYEVLKTLYRMQQRELLYGFKKEKYFETESKSIFWSFNFALHSFVSVFKFFCFLVQSNYHLNNNFLRSSKTQHAAC